MSAAGAWHERRMSAASLDILRARNGLLFGSLLTFGWVTCDAAFPFCPAA
jgi:hypothetical protein